MKEDYEIDELTGRYWWAGKTGTLEFLEINLSKKYIVLKNRPKIKVPIKGGKICLDLNTKKLNIIIEFKEDKAKRKKYLR